MPVRAGRRGAFVASRRGRPPGAKVLEGCVAAPDGLKSETFCRDLKILQNPAAERPVATASATVHILSVSDAQDRSLKPREALETR